MPQHYYISSAPCAAACPATCLAVLYLQQFSDVGHSMLTMFTYALGGVDLDIMLGSSNPEAAIFLSLLYQFAMGTVLMSLLTGAGLLDCYCYCIMGAASG